MPPLQVQWAPQPGPQTEAICADWCPEILYGGAAGGGKSDYLLGDFLQDVPTYGQAWRGVIFRRTYPELEELLARAHEIYPPSGATWHEQKKTWTWPSGANLKMRYLESDLDALRYQGHSYSWVGWDELTQWPTAYAYKYLTSRLRSAFKVKTKRIRGAANPGGPGHAWVKDRFVDPAPQGLQPIIDQDTGLERMFIPAKLRDNTILVANDPEYAQRLKGVGSKTLVDALLAGDWSVIEGAFFDCWSAARHVLRPFEIPEHWARFRSADWGSAKPFSVGWWAVATDEMQVFNALGDRVTIPRGAMVRYREWYGASAPNVGLKMTAYQVALGIKDREKDDQVTTGVIDPAAFSENGGPSIAETMTRESIFWLPADNARVGTRGAMGGWDQMRGRLIGDGDGNPMLFVFSTCVDTIRTLPLMQHDPRKPEDLQSDLEDHAVDEIRYACMSRPYARQSVQKIASAMTAYRKPASASNSWMSS